MGLSAMAVCQIRPWRTGLRAGLVLAAVAVGLAPDPLTAMPSAPRRDASTPSPLVHRVAVFGADQRRPLSDARRDLASKIGLLIDRGSNAVCTAFCVADDIIATAGHCLFRTEGETTPDPLDFVFRLAGLPQSRTMRIAGRETRTTQENIRAGSKALTVKPPIGASHDWALIRLEGPACPAGGLPLSHRTPDELTVLARQSRLYQAAFHRDFTDWQLAEDRDCAAERTYPSASTDKIAIDFAKPSDLILHTCDTGGGSSGSPLLIDGPNGPEVAGINVGTYIQSKVRTDSSSAGQHLKSENVANTAVSSAPAMEALAEFQSEAVLVTRADMRRLQASLRQMKLFEGKIDGVFGPATRVAIERFEARHDSPVRGRATRRVLERASEIATALDPKGVDAPQTIETGSLGVMKSARSGPRRTLRLNRQR